MNARVLANDWLIDFCKRWKIVELAVFGSALREDFRPDSDLDILVRFAPDSQWGLFDCVQMQDELQTHYGRAVDLVSREAVEESSNPIRRKSILEAMEIIYGMEIISR